MIQDFGLLPLWINHHNCGKQTLALYLVDCTYVHIQDLVRTLQRTQLDCCENYTEYINTLCQGKCELSALCLAVHAIRYII